MSSALLSRIARPSLLPRITTPDKLIPHFKNGMTIGWSGFSPAGYPKAMPLKLAEYVEENDLQGQLQFSVLAGASVGSEGSVVSCEFSWVLHQTFYTAV